MEERSIPDLNIFMMCEKLNEEALREIPDGFHLRNCQESELDIWKKFPFDTLEEQKEYLDYMTNYFNNVYAPYGDLFYQKCLFICDKFNNPVATCFAWKAYDKFYTIHWLKVLECYEGKGLGRAILSKVMKSIPKEEYPVYLHTQPGSFRAIKLYSDFGFSILTDPMIGNRENQYKEANYYLKQFMKESHYKKLTYKSSDGKLSTEALKSSINQF